VRSWFVCSIGHVRSWLGVKCVVLVEFRLHQCEKWPVGSVRGTHFRELPSC
jgi:hypothetical protein